MSGVAFRARKRLGDFVLDTGWRVRDGITVLFGYSGAGKSLTLSILVGTERPDEGRVQVGGEVLVDTAAGVFVPPQRRRSGYVPQSGGLFPHLDVRGNVGFGLAGLSRAERAARVSELVAAFDLRRIATLHPAELSGGQRQRVALARALAPRPRLLVLDEPLSSLDLPVRAEMRTLLRDVQREWGIPVVMVTHDLYEAAELADTLVVYSGTGVTQTGSPAELVGDPGTPEIRRLLHAVRLPDGMLDCTRRQEACA